MKKSELVDRVSQKVDILTKKTDWHNNRYDF